MMTAAKYFLTQRGYSVVGGYMAMSEIEGASDSENDRRYQLMKLACQTADGTKDWLKPAPKSIVAKNYNELVRLMYNHIKPNYFGSVTLFKVMGTEVVAESKSSMMNHAIVFGRDKLSTEYTQSLVARENATARR